MHYTEDDLILYYYGEHRRRVGVEQHLADCGSCRALYQDIAASLALVADPEVPERGDQYGLEVWQRIRHQLPEQEAPWWAVWTRPHRLALAGGCGGSRAGSVRRRALVAARRSSGADDQRGTRRLVRSRCGRARASGNGQRSPRAVGTGAPRFRQRVRHGRPTGRRELAAARGVRPHFGEPPVSRCINCCRRRNGRRGARRARTEPPRTRPWTRVVDASGARSHSSPPGRCCPAVPGTRPLRRIARARARTTTTQENDMSRVIAAVFVASLVLAGHAASAQPVPIPVLPPAAAAANRSILRAR